MLKKNTDFLVENKDVKEGDAKENLLNTIKMPKNLRYLKEKLPKPQYDLKLLSNSYD